MLVWHIYFARFFHCRERLPTSLNHILQWEWKTKNLLVSVISIPSILPFTPPLTYDFGGLVLGVFQAELLKKLSGDFNSWAVFVPPARDAAEAGQATGKLASCSRV